MWTRWLLRLVTGENPTPFFHQFGRCISTNCKLNRLHEYNINRGNLSQILGRGWRCDTWKWSLPGDKLETPDESVRERKVKSADGAPSSPGDGVRTVRVCEASTLTDVCNSLHLPEVEIISLIEEQIPRYKLRANTLTTFGGYENEDWFIPSPALSVDTDVDLSPEQAEETLKYFALCANRVSQMTKTYNDIDAVTRLLEEKEKDLELAARIGQSLLQRNKVLEEKNEQLEDETSSLGDKVTQLRHELQMKSDLLRIYAKDLDWDSDSGEGGPSTENLAVLTRKLRQLEEENLQLQSATSKISSETLNLEAREQQLVTDCIKELEETKFHARNLSDELANKTDDFLRQQEEITYLLAQVADLQARNKKLRLENEDLSSHLQATKECQYDLTAELADFKDKYAEVVDLLHDAQEQIRTARKKGLPSASKRGSSLNYFMNPDSLASEIESSLSTDSGSFSPNAKQLHNLKVFETVRTVKQRRNSGSLSSSPAHLPHLYSTSSQGPSASLSTSTSTSYSTMTYGRPVSPLSSITANMPYASQLDSHLGSDSDGSAYTDSYNADDDSVYSSMASLGRNAPPAAELATALRRLSLRRQSEHEYLISDRKPTNDGTVTPNQCRTPDSIMSTGSALTGLSLYGYRHYHMPDKLQIVKPLEGSMTLHQWQQLATPHLGGIFDERPGVQIKGERKLEGMDEVYNLTDYEEDDDFYNPGKRFESTGSVYTYTMSTVLHPDENTHVTSSTMHGTQMATSSVPSSCLCSPQGRERATSTFSTTMGLAKLLHERGIVGGVPDAISSPSSEKSFSPTATPCNSPEGSPPPSPTPFAQPLRLPSVAALGGTLSRRPDLLMDGRVKTTRPRSDKTREGAKKGNINLVAKLNKIGLETIMLPANANPVSSFPTYTLPSYPYPLRMSPMAQLTGVKAPTSPVAKRDSTVSPSNAGGSQVPASFNLGGPPLELGTIGTLSSFRKGGPS